MKRINRIVERLQETYPEARCELDHQSPYELLIATVLSAQSTDKRVNIVTAELFQRYNTPEKMLELGEAALSEKIRTIGFFNAKSRNIILLSRMLMEKYEGRVPGTMEELTELPGVGRKTANVVLSNAFGVPAFAVDTHVFRLARRLGLSQGKTPDEVEKDVTKKLAKKYWTQTHHLLIFHGRRTCKAQRPLCGQCTIADLCRYKGKVME
ncbi:MAG: endonuclease III [Peptostreptococcaceae bacterium]|nr:endonuclease III [Peptostreptococcaceae bacterium]